MEHSKILYILIAFTVICLIRVLPLTLIRRQIKSRFIRSFLYYVPYVTLAVMTFPAIVHATNSPFAGAAALIAGILAALWRGNLMMVAGICCTVVLVLETFI